MPGARVRHARRETLNGTRPARSTQPKVVLDLPKREVRLFLFFSESDAQQLAALLRKKSSPTVVIAQLKSLYETTLKRILSTDPAGAVRIISEAAPTENLSMPFASSIVRVLGSKLSTKVRDWLAAVLSKEFTQNYEKVASDIVRAASDDRDGMTLQITFQSPPILEQVRKALKGGLGAIPGVAKAFAKDTLGSYTLHLRPGFGIK